MALPIITNITDVGGSTIDDAANLPQSSYYQCTRFSLDVRGPGFSSGGVTWVITDADDVDVTSDVVTGGAGTIQINLLFDQAMDPGTYTVTACLTAAPTDCSTHTFTLLELPAITIGVPNQAHVGGMTQFETAYPYAVEWLPAEVDDVTGLATWASAGIKTVSYTPEGQSCPVELEYLVYADVDVAEYDGENCLYISSGDTLALTVSGGSGEYSFSISGQNSVSSTGVIQAGLYAGEYTLIVIDNNAGVIQTIPVCIGSQTQFCVEVAASACDSEVANPCCEISVECGESVTLKVPTFHLRVNGIQEEISYSSYGGGTVDTGGYLKSSASGITDALANIIKSDSGESLFEIVTSLDMADIPNDPFGIGFSPFQTGSGVNSIANAIVWFTDTGVRYVEFRKEGVSVADSKFAITQGDVVSAGFKDGKFVLYINNLLKFETTDIAHCGNQTLDISIEEQNKSIGGDLTGLTWSIVTMGSPSDVGTINANGLYASPANGNYGLVQAEASVGNAVFRINIRNVKPSLRLTHPNAFLAGRNVEVWVGRYIAGFNETIRLAKDGSPDAIQNPGMINLGTLEGSAKFQEQMEYQDFDNDIGTYLTTISKEKAELTATFLEVRDLYKMTSLMPYATLYAKNNGTREMGVGGKTCGVGELRVIMVVGQASCDGEFDVLYLPRVQNKGNLGLEVGRKTNGKYEINFTALPDFSRPSGRQLYSIYQIDGCSAPACV